MRRQTSIILTLILLTILGCNNERKFPLVKNLTEFKRTDFLLTLDHEISTDRNSIYCVTFLYAWDEVKNAIKTPLQIDKSLHDLNLIDRSENHLGTLKTNEYSSTGIVTGELIEARAEFKKSLPFEIDLLSFDDKLTFDNIKVSSFGLSGHDYEKSKNVRIVYYKDDNNFIIKLLPLDNEHEIFLFKTEAEFKSMAGIVSEIDLKSKIGQTEKQNEGLSWKYYLTEDDEVIIPKFQFNIETNYPTLEGNRFRSANKDYEIETAWQRTAFILDEKGAEVESEAEMFASTEEEDEEELPKPKKMRFDKPFFLMLKRVDSENPYFALWTADTELMLKQ